MTKQTTTAPKELYATRGLTRFRCIADQCEDTCCAGLQVPLTQPELDRIRQALAVDEAGAQLLRQAVVTEGLSEEHAGALSKNKGCCGLLDGRGLCSLLTRGHAYTVMPDACITFPRRFGAVFSRVEVFGSCACPEMARLALLADDGLELVPAGPEVSGLYPDTNAPRSSPEPSRPMPYYEALEVVRAWGMERLSDSWLPLAARLLSFTELGKYVDGFFHQGAVEEDPQRLDAALYVVTSPDTGAELKAAVAQPAEPAVLGAVLWAVWSVLKTKLGAASGRLDRLLPPALARWGGERAGAEVLAQGYAAAVQALPPRAEVILARYCACDWQQEFYFAAANLTERGRWLLARACAARLLIAAHPVLGDPAADPAAVDAALIEAIQLATKHFERDRRAAPAMLEALGREVPDPAEQALAMARFCT